MATTIIKPSGEVTRLSGKPAQVSPDMRQAGMHEGDRVVTDRTGALLRDVAGTHERAARDADRSAAKANQNLDRTNRRAARHARKEHERIIAKAAQQHAASRDTDQERQEQRAIMAAGREQLDATRRLSGKVGASTNGRAVLLYGTAAENSLLDQASREQLELDLTLLNQVGKAVERAGRSEDLKPGEALALATQVGVAPVLAAEAELVQVTAQLNNPEIDDEQRNRLEEQLELINYGINQSAEFAMVQGPSIPAAMARDIEIMLLDGLRVGGFQYARENSTETARMESFSALFRPSEVPTSSFAYAA